MSMDSALKRALIFSLGLGVVTGIGLASQPAFAAPPTKEACITAFDQAQQARRAGHFGQSREQLLVCSQTACPSVVRADCADVLKQVAAAQPTIVLKAADAHGTDLTDVSVDLNGKSLTSTLDGRAIAVDPGKLALVFSRPPWKPVPVEVVIAEGEKGRIVQATLGPPLPPSERRDFDGPPLPPPKRSTVGWAVPIGLGVVGVASFIIAGVTRIGVGNDADADRSTGGCAPFCSATERDDLSGKLVRANVFLGIGIGTAVLAAASWFVLAPKRSTRARGALSPTLLTW